MRRLLALTTLAALGFCTPAMAQAPPAPVVQQLGPNENPGGNQVLHILVGHSVVIHTDPRLTRVLVGNPAVVTTETTAPNEVVVTATAPGSSSLVLWQENNQSRTIEVFADLDVSLLREATARNFPNEAIQVEAEEGRVLLSGTASSAAVADQIGKMGAPFSKDVVNSIRLAPPTRQKQVMVKVRFAQVDRTKLTAFGINWFSTGGNTFGQVSTQQFSPPQLVRGASGGGTGVDTSSIGLSDLLNIFLFRPDLNLGVTIKALQQK